MSRFSHKGERELREMLEVVGVSTVDELFASIPREVVLRRPLDLPPACSEDRLLRELAALAARNQHAGSCISFLGAGIYDHFVPSAVSSVTGRAEFATAYTPYQAEGSQGTLQAIFEFQTMLCELTGMDVANASLYDAGSAVAEAIQLAAGATRRSRALVAAGVHPFYVEVARTYCTSTAHEIATLPAAADGIVTASALDAALAAAPDVGCVVIQQPNYLGRLEELEALVEVTHARGALLAAVVDPVALGLLQSPGEAGADLAVGEGQPFGIHASFGGPGFGFFAGRAAQLRRLPGRLVGETVDARGRRGYVLTLQTREQHIRRARATSNICTNQGLMATAATVAMSLLGPAGLREMAVQCLQRAHYAAGALAAAGAPRLHEGPFFREFAVRAPVPAERLVEEGLTEGILAGVPLRRLDPGHDAHALLVAVTERRSRQDIDRLAALVRRLARGSRARGALQEA